MFNEHVETMTYEFERKTQQFEQTKTQLVENHDFIRSFYVEMQTRLNEKRDQIMAERD